MRIILKRQEVCEKTGLSKSTIYRLIKKKEFPPPINLSDKRVGWVSEDIERWIEIRRRRGSKQA